jgi:hypothetical protein
VRIFFFFLQNMLNLESKELCSTIQAGTGRFELCLNNKIVLSGNIFVFDDLKFKNTITTVHKENSCEDLVSLNHDEVYSSLEQFGYCVGNVFKTVKRVDIFKNSTFFFFARLYYHINVIIVYLFFLAQKYSGACCGITTGYIT